MGFLSFSLLSKILIVVGATSIATTIPLSFFNKEENQIVLKAAEDNTLAFREESVNSLNNEMIHKVLNELESKSCQESYRKEQARKLGTFYICSPNSLSEQQEQLIGEEGNWGYLLYVEDEMVIENSRNTKNISEIIKKVVSIIYEKGKTESEGRIIFRLEGEADKKTLLVNSQGSWKYFGLPEYFHSMENFLDPIYNAP